MNARRSRWRVRLWYPSAAAVYGLSARMTAENVASLQRRVDAHACRHGIDPALVLLEMPPLTYFGCGELAIPEFFDW